MSVKEETFGKTAMNVSPILRISSRSVWRISKLYLGHSLSTNPRRKKDRSLFLQAWWVFHFYECENFSPPKREGRAIDVSYEYQETTRKIAAGDIYSMRQLAKDLKLFSELRSKVRYGKLGSACLGRN